MKMLKIDFSSKSLFIWALFGGTHKYCYFQVFERPWPGMMRTVYGSQERYETTYFKKFPGFYCTGDGKCE